MFKKTDENKIEKKRIWRAGLQGMINPTNQLISEKLPK
jgi:hypothetical protein